MQRETYFHFTNDAVFCTTLRRNKDLCMGLIEKGSLYTKLKKSYIAFICTEDPFDRGLSVYRFSKRCAADPGLLLGDETETIFLNAKGNQEGLDEELVKFLDYLKNHIPTSEFTKQLEAQVAELNKDTEWRRDQMTVGMEIKVAEYYAQEKGRAEGMIQGRAEGIAEGMIQGRAEGMRQTVLNYARDGIITPEKAASDLGMSVEELKKLISEP